MKHFELSSWLDAAGADVAFRALATLVPEVAVVVVDGERRVLLWGGDAERLLGWSREEVLGKPCPNAVVCDAEPRPFGAIVRVRRSDAGEVVVRHFGRSFLDDAGRSLGAIHVLAAAEPQAAELRTPASDVVEFHGLATRDAVMVRVFDTIRNVAATDVTVLVRGESGTGKELVARAIHAESRRRDGPFVAVNCAAFSPTLLESELFGHVKGAFTGAVSDRAGIFARADHGTLFLDEVAELPLDLQAKLLRVLQERTFTPVGGTKPVHVDVRVIAATHRALREEVRSGRFREDLMYRLRVVPIFLPPLRERRPDIDVYVRRFVERHNATGPRYVNGVSPDAMRMLLEHAWPGNVREVENVVAYAFAVGRAPEIRPEDLPPEFRERRRARPMPVVDEADTIREAIRSADGDLERAAAALGVSRTTLWRKRKRLGV